MRCVIPNISSTIRLLPQPLLWPGPSASLATTHPLIPPWHGPGPRSSYITHIRHPVLWQLWGVITGASGPHRHHHHLNKRWASSTVSSRAMSPVVNPSILRLNPARKLCYYGGKLRKIFGCIGFKLELTRAITDKKNAGNVGECITKARPSHVAASLGITFLWFVSNWVGDRSWAQRGGGIVFTCVNTSW